MKLGIGRFALMAVVVYSTGCSPCPKPPRTDDPVLSLSPAEQRTACEAAGKKLADLKCKESRADFTDFCMNALEGGIPIRPLCLASMTKCEEVDSRCRQ